MMSASLSSPLLHVSAYRFMHLDQAVLGQLQHLCHGVGQRCGIKGSVILSQEGVNLSLAGTPDAVHHYQSHLETVPILSGLVYRKTWSVTAPFTRFLVKIKAHLLPFSGRADSLPVESTVRPTHLSPSVFYQWYAENQPMQILDARNTYEYKLGHFRSADHLGIETFRACGTALATLAHWKKHTPVVTYCTGGIRCEQVVPWLVDQGFEHVYQLEGGIVAYFEQCGSRYYEGECFMFDKRIAIDGNRNETGTVQCYACRLPVTASQQADYAMHCPDCGASLLK